MSVLLSHASHVAVCLPHERTARAADGRMRKTPAARAARTLVLTRDVHMRVDGWGKYY